MDRTSSITIRGNTFAQVDPLIKEAQSRLPKPKAFPDDTGLVAIPPEKAQSAAPICAIHNIPMNYKSAGVSRKTGKPYPAFWSCSERLPNGLFCSFRPST